MSSIPWISAVETRSGTSTWVPVSPPWRASIQTHSIRGDRCRCGRGGGNPRSASSRAPVICSGARRKTSPAEACRLRASHRQWTTRARIPIGPRVQGLGGVNVTLMVAPTERAAWVCTRIPLGDRSTMRARVLGDDGGSSVTGSEMARRSTRRSAKATSMGGNIRTSEGGECPPLAGPHQEKVSSRLVRVIFCDFWG